LWNMTNQPQLMKVVVLGDGGVRPLNIFSSCLYFFPTLSSFVFLGRKNGRYYPTRF
jgi:hypothetical protein